MSLHFQWITLGMMAVCGMLMGIAFDSCSVLKRKWPWVRGSFLFLLDLFFWAASTALVFSVLFHLNDGELRLYVFGALLFGFWTYGRLFGAWYRRGLEHLLTIVWTLCRFVMRIVYWIVVKPLIGLYKLMVSIVVFFLVVMVAIVRWLGKGSLIVLKKGAGFFRRMAKGFKQDKK